MKYIGFGKFYTYSVSLAGNFYCLFLDNACVVSTIKCVENGG